MSKLQIVTARELEKILLKMGFEIKRQKGSHVFYRHADGRYTTIPHHKGKQLTRSLIRRILSQVKLSVEDYKEMLSKI